MDKCSSSIFLPKNSLIFGYRVEVGKKKNRNNFYKISLGGREKNILKKLHFRGRRIEGP